MYKRVKIYLYDRHISKLKNILIQQGKNPNKKASELIRNIIDSSDLNTIYFKEQDLLGFNIKNKELVESGQKLNHLLHDLNIEHIKMLKGEENNYVFDVNEYMPVLEEINDKISNISLEIKNLRNKKDSQLN